MKHFKSIFLFMPLFFLGINLCLGQNDWIRYKADADLTFTVDVPGDMEFSTKTIKTVIGELQTLTYVYQGEEEDPNYMYLINMVQYPEGTFPSDSVGLIEEYLDNAILSSVDKVGGELVYATEIDNKKSKIFRLKYNEGNAVVKGRTLIKNDVFINLQVFTVQSKSLNNEIDVFLDSFNIGF